MPRVPSVIRSLTTSPGQTAEGIHPGSGGAHDRAQEVARGMQPRMGVVEDGGECEARYADARLDRLYERRAVVGLALYSRGVHRARDFVKCQVVRDGIG